MIIEGFDSRLFEGRNIFLVCGNSFDRLGFSDEIKRLDPVRFGGFTPNPKYEEILEGVDLFKRSGCDAILAVGGGSAIDAAKCMKFYSKSSAELIAIPTTSGSGSEATHFAVMYRDGVKQSVSHESLLPGIAILEPSALFSVPEYTRKATMLDALCHAIESYWSKRATDESRELAAEAVGQILKHKDSYLENESTGNLGMLRAANLAGQAINITTTTAAHAMCYQLTGLYGLAHGHAAALCLQEIWKANKADVPGITVDEFEQLFEELGLAHPVRKSDRDMEILASSVNAERLGNNPVDLDKETIRQIYERIVR